MSAAFLSGFNRASGLLHVCLVTICSWLLCMTLVLLTCAVLHHIYVL